MEQWYRAAGAIAIAARRRSAARWAPSTHAYGGTRMGDNAETNVVNRWGFSHEVPNLGVLGASVMGTSGARNPTLHRAGAGVADGRAHREELEGDYHLAGSIRYPPRARRQVAATPRTLIRQPPEVGQLDHGLRRCVLTDALFDAICLDTAQRAVLSCA